MSTFYRWSFNVSQAGMILAILALIHAPLICNAQSIRDTVKQHVEESLEQEKSTKDNAEKDTKDKTDTSTKDPSKQKTDKKKQDKPKKSDTSKKSQKSSPSSGNGVTLFEFDSQKPKEKDDGKPKLPYRIIHENFKMDISTGVGYRGWAPQQYPTVEVDIANYFTWSVDVKARLFNFFSLKRGYYESNAISSPRAPYKSDAAKYGSYGVKAAWFLAEMGIPILNAWEPTIRYETRAFQTTAKTKGDAQVCIIPFNTDADSEGCDTYGDKMSVVSSFETAVVGVTYYPSKNPSPVIEDRRGKKPPFFFGLGYMSYIKPYQVTVGDSVLDEYLFTGRFYGGGLAFGTKLGGGVNRPHFNIWTQFGLGASRLTKDLTLNEVAPSDWLIGYIQGNARLSFKWAPFKFAPTILLIPSGEVSGATFFFFETDVQEGEKFVMPGINWDILYTVRLTLVVTL